MGLDPVTHDSKYTRWDGQIHLTGIQALVRLPEQTLRESLSPGNHALAVQIAALPRQIRGFGDVKRASWERVKREEKALLDRFLEREHAGAEEAEGGNLGGASDIEHL